MAITPDGKHAYVADNSTGLTATGAPGGNTVSVIDTATGAVSDTITVGNDPVGVAITPDGKHVYVANCVDNTVTVIDTATGAVSATIAVGTSPIGVAICPA